MYDILYKYQYDLKAQCFINNFVTTNTFKTNYLPIQHKLIKKL